MLYVVIGTEESSTEDLRPKGSNHVMCLMCVVYKQVVYSGTEDPALGPDNSEVCHPRCVFKLQSGVNFSQKHNYKYG